MSKTPNSMSTALHLRSMPNVEYDQVQGAKWLHIGDVTIFVSQLEDDDRKTFFQSLIDVAIAGLAAIKEEE